VVKTRDEEKSMQKIVLEALTCTVLCRLTISIESDRTLTIDLPARLSTTVTVIEHTRSLINAEQHDIR